MEDVSNTINSITTNESLVQWVNSNDVQLTLVLIPFLFIIISVLFIIFYDRIRAFYKKIHWVPDEPEPKPVMEYWFEAGSDDMAHRAFKSKIYDTSPENLACAETYCKTNKTDTYLYSMKFAPNGKIGSGHMYGKWEYKDGDGYTHYIAFHEEKAEEKEV